MMKLTVLGSGTSVPHPLRTASAYWLETADASLLLDCSPTAPSRIAQENLDWADLDAIWISHFHIDHCGGLPAFLAGTKYAAATKYRTRPLKIFGGAGLRLLLERFDAVGNYRLFEQPFPVEIIEVEPLERFSILPNVSAVAASTRHTNESLALHLSYDQKTLVYTADTGFDETLAAFARKVDLLVMECSFVREKPSEKHVELAEAIYLIRKAEPKRTILTHFYPQWDGVIFADEIAKFSTKLEIIEAFDGLGITV